MYPIVWRILFCSPFLFYTGCGYTLNHRLIPEFKGNRAFFVPVFKNETEELGAEIVFTNAFIHEMESHGERVVSKRDHGGVEIVGSIDSIQRTVASRSAQGFQGLNNFVNIPDSISVEVRVGLQFVDIQTGKIIFTRFFTNSRAAYAPQNRTHDIDAPSVFPLATESVIQLAYAEIARVMMRDVYDNLVVF